jgi:hypothetical protein
MRGCWHFGAQPVRLAPSEVIGVAGVWGTVGSLFAILGGEVMAQHGYLEERWDPEAELPGAAAPWPVVDILDDGRVVARRVVRGFPGPAVARPR